MVAASPWTRRASPLPMHDALPVGTGALACAAGRKPSGTFPPLHFKPAQSYRNASTGSIRDALTAGKNPEITPTSVRMMNDASITVDDACRKISPSWFDVL